MIIFTSHAILKLAQREISKTIVIKALNSPDHKFKSYSNRTIIYKRFDRLYLKVVYRIENNNIIVITQHWEEKPKLTK